VSLHIIQHAKSSAPLVDQVFIPENPSNPPLAVVPVLITLFSLIILQIMPKKRQHKLKPKNPTQKQSISHSVPGPGSVTLTDAVEKTASCSVVQYPQSTIVDDWFSVYEHQSQVHEKIAQILVSTGHITADSTLPSADIKRAPRLLRPLPDTLTRQLGVLMKELFPQETESANISYRSVTPPTKATTSMQTSPSQSPLRSETPLVDAQLVDESRFLDHTILGVPQTRRVACTLNKEFDLSLEFMNRGNNSAHDIQTYLQEKLDVLDFLQQDDTTSRMKDKVETSRLHLPRRAQEQPSSVSDWLNDTGSGPSSSVPSGGFFIGTPAPSVVSVDDDSSVLEVDAALLNDSDVRWETDSMISSASSRRGRDRSVSLFSHYRGRDRVSRLAANSLDFGETDDGEIENSYIENASVLGKSAGFGFGTGRWF